MTQEEKSILDKAKDLATDIKEKVSTYVEENEEKIKGAVEKTGEFSDDKTKGRFTDKIDKAQDAAKKAVDKVAHTDEKTEPTATSTADDTSTEPKTADTPPEASPSTEG